MLIHLVRRCVSSVQQTVVFAPQFLPRENWSFDSGKSNGGVLLNSLCIICALRIGNHLAKEEKPQTEDIAPKPAVTTEKGLADAVSRFFQILPTIASIIVGFTAFAYIIGWLHARSYFDGFGAPWVVSEISTTTLLGFSWLPLSQLFFFIYLGVTDLMESSTRYKMTIFILRHGWWFVLLLYLIAFILGLTKFQAVGDAIESFLPLSFTLVAAAAVESILIRLQQREFKWELGTIYLVYGVVLFGFYYLPIQMGKNDAKRDRDPQRSSLAEIRLRDDERQNLRLLATSSNRFYVVALDSSNAAPEIRVVDFTQVQHIVKPSQKK